MTEMWMLEMANNQEYDGYECMPIGVFASKDGLHDYITSHPITAEESKRVFLEDYTPCKRKPSYNWFKIPVLG